MNNRNLSTERAYTSYVNNTIIQRFLHSVQKYAVLYHIVGIAAYFSLIFVAFDWLSLPNESSSAWKESNLPHDNQFRKLNDLKNVLNHYVNDAPMIESFLNEHDGNKYKGIWSLTEISEENPSTKDHKDEHIDKREDNKENDTKQDNDPEMDNKLDNNYVDEEQIYDNDEKNIYKEEDKPNKNKRNVKKMTGSNSAVRLINREKVRNLEKDFNIEKIFYSDKKFLSKENHNNGIQSGITFQEEKIKSDLNDEIVSSIDDTSNTINDSLFLDLPFTDINSEENPSNFHDLKLFSDFKQNQGEIKLSLHVEKSQYSEKNLVMYYEIKDGKYKDKWINMRQIFPLFLNSNMNFNSLDFNFGYNEEYKENVKRVNLKKKMNFNTMIFKMSMLSVERGFRNI